MIDESLQSIREFRYTAFRLIINICIKKIVTVMNYFQYTVCSMHIAGSYTYIHYIIRISMHHSNSPSSSLLDA